MARDSREIRKWKAARRAQFRLKQAFERIDWEEDVLLGEVAALQAGTARAEIGPADAVIETVPLDECA
ncbi:MAG TPA: hypothetical protein VFA05_04320 [Gaiellaceae bacterium]|nr:hypothetical protein [Gaiellaceae bacterium]